MMVTYLRSSSYNAWDWCENRFWIEYTLGIRGIANLKADKGNVTHKALELLARKKQAQQNGDPEFTDPELARAFDTAAMCPEAAIELAYHHYTKVKHTTHNWKPVDFRDCRQWMYDTLLFNGGMFSPLNRKVLCPEQYFDFPIEEPWASYDYVLPNGERLTGHLAVKGTVDLVTEIRPGLIEYLDWKTGLAKDWATGERKTYGKLCDDPQLRLYHYALSRLYPDVEQIIITIFFVRDGGPSSICFQPSDVKRTLEMVKRRFDVIRTTTRPRLTKTWKCDRLCHYGKNNWPGTEKTICEHIHRETLQLGMDKVFAKYGNLDAVRSYGEGGGQSNREGK